MYLDLEKIKKTTEQPLTGTRIKIKELTAEYRSGWGYSRQADNLIKILALLLL
jgi:hypothetical protein